MEKLRICSLFSGIGGFEEGIYQAIGKENTNIVFSSEIDKFASGSYAIMHEHIPNGDITQVDARDIPDHDLLVAGFPCQAFSIAGKRKGFDDTRGTLFFEVAKILKEKHPPFFILENVKGLLSHNKGETFEVILETLHELDYTFHYKVLNSKHHNVPQNRERVFIVGSANKDFHYDFPSNDTVTKAIKDILEDSVDEKFYLKPEQVAKFKPKEYKNSDVGLVGNISNTGHNGSDVHSVEGISPCIGVSSSDETKIMVEGNLDLKGWQEQQCRVYNEKGLAPTLTTGKPSKFLETKEIGVYDPYNNILSRDQRIVGTLRTNYSNGNPQIIEKTKTEFRIRKLTPKECLRIQGFPDTYYDTLKEHGVSNTQLYKMAGNAVSPPVIAALVKNLITKGGNE